jgi:hypothetical protein
VLGFRRTPLCLTSVAVVCRSTITTNSAWHLSQPRTQQTRHPSMRSPMAAGLNKRRNLASICMANHAWLGWTEQSRRGWEGPRSALAADNHAQTLSGKALVGDEREDAVRAASTS